VQFCNQSNGDNCANIEKICTKFDRETDSRVLEHVLPSNFLFVKIQNGAGHHIEIHIFGHRSITLQAPDTSDVNKRSVDPLMT